MRTLINQHRGANRRRAKAHVYKHPPPSLKYNDSRGAFTMFHPPPNSNQGTSHYIGNSGVPISRLKAFTFKHPPPSKNTWVNKTQKYAKDTYDNSAVTRQRIGFISQTDPQIGIRQKTDALVSAKRNEAGRACS